MKKHLLYGALQLMFFVSAADVPATKNLASSWQVVAMPAPVLTCTYAFYSMPLALYFMERVEELGFYFNYYPSMYLIGSHRVCIELFTSGFFDLTEYDFLMAQAIDQLFYLEFAV